jgi:uncharacterized membrane protein
MSEQIFFVLTLVSAIGCGLIAGVFFAFSSFVMKALARLPAAQGIAAMQSINVAVINPWFMTAFLGTGAGCAVVAVLSGLRWQESGSAYALAGSLLYLCGTILVTGVCNVPRNNALAQGAVDWPNYVAQWTAWNHVRTAAALIAAVLLVWSASWPTPAAVGRGVGIQSRRPEARVTVRRPSGLPL